MKPFSNRIYFYFLAIVFSTSIVILPSCSKDDNEDPIVTETYVSHEKLTTYTSVGIKSLYEGAQILFPEVGQLIPEVEYDVDVYKVVYNTPFMGETIEASGLVCIPVSTTGKFPIVSFQNGTNTAHADAPTEDYTNMLFRYLESGASMGYIVIIPDYIGFGSSENITHPYLHKESTVKSVENLIIATGEMFDVGLVEGGWNQDVFLMGYSQGGWSTLSTHKYISEMSNPPFNIVASSCGAGPYDLSVVQEFMFSGETFPQPVYMAYTAVSYHSLGLVTNPLSDYFNEPYATALPTYFDGSMTNGEINLMLNDTVSVLVTNEFLTGVNTNPVYEDFRNAMHNNSVFGWKTEQPINLYHGTADIYVPPTTTDIVYEEFIAAGASEIVTYIPLQDKDHLTGAVPMVVSSLVWFNELN